MATATIGTKNYVMFQNPGETDIYALYLVGFTDKADDPNTIGMFGSGFKQAATAALRLGIDLVVYLGRDKITFKTVARRVNGDDVRQLVFVWESPDGQVKELDTSLTLGYGAKDWKKPWPKPRARAASATWTTSKS